MLKNFFIILTVAVFSSETVLAMDYFDEQKQTKPASTNYTEMTDNKINTDSCCKRFWRFIFCCGCCGCCCQDKIEMDQKVVDSLVEYYKKQAEMEANGGTLPAPAPPLAKK